MNYTQWALKHPQAALDLQELIGALPFATNTENEGRSENWAQQQIKFKVGRAGAYAWRNNVGATPTKIKAKCPGCGSNFQIRQPPIRYGLANDSMQLNKVVKSSDLILAIPRLITPQMVGTTMAQFGSVEAKKPGWKYSGTEQEQGQAYWLALISSIGGYACFSTGDLTI